MCFYMVKLDWIKPQKTENTVKTVKNVVVFSQHKATGYLSFLTGNSRVVRLPCEMA